MFMMFIDFLLFCMFLVCLYDLLVAFCWYCYNAVDLRVVVMLVLLTCGLVGFGVRL